MYLVDSVPTFVYSSLGPPDVLPGVNLSLRTSFRLTLSSRCLIPDLELCTAVEGGLVPNVCYSK